MELNLCDRYVKLLNLDMELYRNPQSVAAKIEA